MPEIDEFKSLMEYQSVTGGGTVDAILLNGKVAGIESCTVTNQFACSILRNALGCDPR